ncbi:hypothetical protein Axi01nite_61940 [Actinoplanes xinjiangensis]|nr:hypothetical protein Axi01nite_61940 [Actinoplanes xinjiangensis]
MPHLSLRGFVPDEATLADGHRRPADTNPPPHAGSMIMKRSPEIDSRGGLLVQFSQMGRVRTRGDGFPRGGSRTDGGGAHSKNGARTGGGTRSKNGGVRIGGGG